MGVINAELVFSHYLTRVRPTLYVRWTQLKVIMPVMFCMDHWLSKSLFVQSLMKDYHFVCCAFHSISCTGSFFCVLLHKSSLAIIL